MSNAKELSQNQKMLLEMGPLIAFFMINSFGNRFGLTDDNRFMVATGVLIVGVVLSLIAQYVLTKKLSFFLILMSIPVVLFGGLTLYYNNETFIKMKPSIVNLLIALTLLIGLFFKKNLLTYLFGQVFKLTNEGWRGLTFRYALFSLLLAFLNEVVWRTQTTDFWVAFKVWGIMPLSLVFMLSQMPFLTKHTIKD